MITVLNAEMDHKITMQAMRCEVCDLRFMTHKSWISERRKTGKPVYCPNGHKAKHPLFIEA